MKYKLGGKTAVVTGASGEIGRAIALRFARSGARVAVHYGRSRAAAERTAEAIRSEGAEAHVLQADLSVEDEAVRLAEEAHASLGRIDAWVNNAGADILTGANSRLNPADRLRRLVAVDLLGTMFCCWEVAPLMQRDGGGAIVNVTWDLDAGGMQGRNPEMFAAIKGGVSAFSRSIARNFAPEVRVNDLAPGWVETAFARELMPRDAYRKVAGRIPLRRFGRPEDIAAAALFLVSDEASYLTGQTLRVNGGIV